MDPNKCIGIATVGTKGQIVIPQNVREMFGINPGDTVIVLADKKRGIALMKSEFIEDIAGKAFDGN
ncbi:MAG: AbrB/MazE/SpoVT family DNA-binding domain-containing protein [Candidatus Enteromonas sp.]|nr:AbrB/MazE/SpoVT family DNA-binding domain-containing protein [Candidatus Enteromonas sp.]MDY6093687.1 AbrB/MazE/SpoVT family DNA-binding domain-containing protein [Candidatus Enteromonas sp.]